MTVKEWLEDTQFEDILILRNYGYDTAFVGVTTDGYAVYDYNKMVEWLMKKEGWSYEDSVEWIEYNTIRSLPYFEGKAPIIIYPCDEEITDSED